MPRLARGCLAAGLALAAFAAAAAQPSGPGPAFAAHADGASNPGKKWTSGATITTYTQYTHTNTWRCDGRAAVRPGTGERYQKSCLQHTLDTTGQAPLPAASVGTAVTRQCTVASAAVSSGCGHTGGGGWGHDGHPHAANDPITDTAVITCTAGGSSFAVTDAAHCGVWEPCPAGQVPNSAGSGCAPCPAGQTANAAQTTCENIPPATTPPPTTEPPPEPPPPPPLSVVCPGPPVQQKRWHKHSPGSGHEQCRAGELADQMQSAAGDHEALARLGRELAEAEEARAAADDRWLELSVELDERSARPGG